MWLISGRIVPVKCVFSLIVLWLCFKMTSFAVYREHQTNMHSTKRSPGYNRIKFCIFMLTSEKHAAQMEVKLPLYGFWATLYACMLRVVVFHVL